tara:strand:+ start:765 stop:1187 length:423 start_codon:yes stop_codon:yes gene_type:complete
VAYEIKPNKGTAFPVDHRLGEVILSGKLNVHEFSTDPNDDFLPKIVVIAEPVAENQKKRLALYVQCGIMFEEDDEEKKYAYSGPFGDGRIFAYREKSQEGMQYLKLSVAPPLVDQPTPQVPSDTTPENNAPPFDIEDIKF